MSSPLTVLTKSSCGRARTSSCSPAGPLMMAYHLRAPQIGPRVLYALQTSQPPACWRSAGTLLGPASTLARARVICTGVVACPAHHDWHHRLRVEQHARCACRAAMWSWRAQLRVACCCPLAPPQIAGCPLIAVVGAAFDPCIIRSIYTTERG